MKTKIILSSLAIAIIFIFSCNNGEKSEATGANQSIQSDAKIIYRCPMHPEVKREKPGQCPECGMDLEKETK